MLKCGLCVFCFIFGGMYGFCLIFGSLGGLIFWGFGFGSGFTLGGFAFAFGSSVFDLTLGSFFFVCS
jgi:hypothetical protein